jgi:acyl-CoA dehydrogenase
MTEPAIAIEALCAGATLSQLFMCNPTFGGVTLTECGSPEMKRGRLPTLTAGKASFAIALTEPYAVANSIALKTFARAGDNGWRLSGQKFWITCLPQATRLLFGVRKRGRDEVRHRTDPISLLMIDVDAAGLTHAAIEKTDTSTLPSSSVFCDDSAPNARNWPANSHRSRRRRCRTTWRSTISTCRNPTDADA